MARLRTWRRWARGAFSRWSLSATVTMGLVFAPRPAAGVDGVSVTTHFEGTVDWTVGGYGPIWRHDIVGSGVVARRELDPGPGRMAVMSYDGSHVAFLRRGTGTVAVMTVGGDAVRGVATAHEQATLDWTDDTTIFYTLGGWYGQVGSRDLRKVDITTGESTAVVKWYDPIWRFHIAHDGVRAVVRPTAGLANGTITTYELPGDGRLDPGRATDAPSCSAGIDPMGKYFLDGMAEHEGLDVRDWESLAIVRSFLHEEVAALWGGPDSGTYHNRNGWSVNSQDWICAHVGWGISPYVNQPTGGNQVLYNWKTGAEERIVVTPNRQGSHAYDSAGDFWAGPPPVPAAVGLRALWLFDSGSLTRDSVGPHTWTLEGGSAGVGVENGAVELVAAEEDHLRIADAALASGVPWKLADGRPEMTVAGWLKKNRAGQREYLVQKGTYSFGLLVEPGGDNDDFCVELGRYPLGDASPSEQAFHFCWEDAIAAGTWVFFAVALDLAGQLRVRLWDQSASAWLGPDALWSLSEPPVFTHGDLVLGCGEWAGETHCFDGAIDDLRLYDRSLTVAELDELVAPPNCTGGICCGAGDVCGAVRLGSGCVAGAVCCESGACAAPACGDGLCSLAETCELDGCCDGQVVDGSASVCCAGAPLQGQCCADTDCPYLRSCVDHLCVEAEPTPDTAPTVDAGADHEDVIASTLLGLDAVVSDADNDPLALAWSQTQGPAAAVIDTPSRLVTRVSFIVGGQYEFQLTADDGVLHTSDRVAVGVSAVPGITLESPRGGEVWTAGEVHRIEWTAVSVSEVAIRYSTDDGLTWKTIESSVDGESEGWGHYPWPVPDEPGSATRVRLDGYFGATNAATSGRFAIRRWRRSAPTRGCDCMGAGGPSLLFLVLGCATCRTRRMRDARSQTSAR